jgi:uncharacterized protein (TIGR02466 family)
MKLMKSQLMNLFPTPVTMTNIGRDFTEDELQLCKTDISIFKDEENGMQNHQSQDFYLFDNFVELKNIKNFCEHQLEQYLKDIEGVDIDLATLRITQSWLNKNKPQEFHPQHLHPNSYLSGVFYINCLPNDGINFTNRTLGNYNSIKFPVKKNTAWNTEGAMINIKEGDLILFPSWMPHYVGVNETKDKERISLSFNTFPIGELGNKIQRTHLKL